MKSQGLMSEMFTFVDAAHLIAKTNLWEERNKAIQKNNMEIKIKIGGIVLFDLPMNESFLKERKEYAIEELSKISLRSLYN